MAQHQAVRRLRVPRPRDDLDEEFAGFGLWTFLFTLTNPSPTFAYAGFSLFYAGPLFGPAASPPDGTQLTLENVVNAFGGSTGDPQREDFPFQLTGPDFAMSAKEGATSVIVNGGLPTLQRVTLYLPGPVFNEFMLLSGTGGPNNAGGNWTIAGSTVGPIVGTWTVQAAIPLLFTWFP
jgi:hypothetical protein